MIRSVYSLVEGQYIIRRPHQRDQADFNSIYMGTIKESMRQQDKDKDGKLKNTSTVI